MSKTIEELASEYYLNEVINGDTCDDKEGWTDCFVSGAQAFMRLSLSDRLTSEEKEMVRKEYADTYPNDFDRGIVNISKACLLVRIFGEDFFKND